MNTYNIFLIWRLRWKFFKLWALRSNLHIFSDLTPIQLVNLDPPTLFGAWLTPDIFVGGNLQGLHGAIKIEAHKVNKTIKFKKI